MDGMKRILLIVLGVVVALLAFISMRPSTYEVSRSIKVNAPAAKIYPWVAQLPKFVEWSPWSGLDPNVKTSFSGTPGAVGSAYAWEGNDEVGKGSLTIKQVQVDKSVELDLKFITPWESVATTRFDLAPQGEAVEVKWSMNGDLDFMGKAMGLFMDMDAMIGPDYEKGLSSLKQKVESQP